MLLQFIENEITNFINRYVEKHKDKENNLNN